MDSKIVMLVSEVSKFIGTRQRHCHCQTIYMATLFVVPQHLKKILVLALFKLND